MDAHKLGRYSFIGSEPFLTLSARGSEITLTQGTEKSHLIGNPFDILNHFLEVYRLDSCSSPVPFIGGAVGYFSYDLRHRIESLPRRCEYDLDVPEFILCLYDGGLVFDHVRGVTEWVGPAGVEPRIPEPAPDGPPERLEPVTLRSNFTRDGYLRAVRRAREYIAAGDIFQVNLSQRFSGVCPSSGLAVYSRLRRLNPAPFSAYLKYPDFEIMCSSPERFLLLDGERVETRPIKGTRPRRAGDPAFNRRMERELLSLIHI